MYTENKESLEEFLKHILVSAVEYDKKNLVSQVCSLLIEEHRTNRRCLNIYDILHYKDKKNNSALYYANYYNLLLTTGTELLYVEKEVHGEDRDGAIKCLRKNAGYLKMDQMLIDSYRFIHPSGKVSKYISASLAAGLQILLSFIFLFWDWISDILLCYQYINIAFYSNEFTRNESCNEAQAIPCLEQTDLETQQTYTIASLIMLITISMTSLAYIWAVFKHTPGKWISNQPTKYRVFFLSIISKIFWPITYLCREVTDRVELGSTGTYSYSSLEESKKYWFIIKTLENGVENAIQMFLQLYLLTPYLSFLTTVPLSKVIQLSVGNIFDFSDSLCEGRNLSIGMSKLFLSILSLSFGASSRQTSKPGISFGQTIKNIFLWLSFVCLSISRIIAILSLVALQSPLPGIVCFLLIHLILVFLILRDKSVSCKNVSIHFQTIMSCVSSHTVLIYFQKKERGTKTFWRQLYFQSLILLENVLLCSLPLIIPDHYPPEGCFDYSHKFIAFVIGLWNIGIILQVRLLKYLDLKLILYAK